MTPLPKKNMLNAKIQTFLFSVCLMLLGKLVSVGGDIYENVISMKTQLVQIQEQYHELQATNNNLRNLQADQFLKQLEQERRIARLESLTSKKK